MQHELGYSTAQLTGAFSLALLISGAAGIAVGRYLDAHSPRGLMSAGSIAATLLVVAWSHVDGLAAFYLVWAGLGLTMAAILYEPAFVVLAKWFPDAAERRRAMTALTLVAALASFIFLPLSQALIDAYGWRDALLMLAAILAAVTIPLHVLALRAAPAPPHTARRARAPGTERVLRTASFWLFTAAFFLANGAAAYGAISGVAASATTAARAVGPVAAAAYAAATGYTTLLWTVAAATLVAGFLAYRSERAAD